VNFDGFSLVAGIALGVVIGHLTINVMRRGRAARAGAQSSSTDASERPTSVPE
jgi:NhaP-type Na+/H+ or K+/H+ antiporter